MSFTLPARGQDCSPPADSARVFRTPAGANLNDDGTVSFRLWAPGAPEVFLLLHGRGRFAMARAEGGWFELTLEARTGELYSYLFPDGLQAPDPASRFQPDDAHGPSEIVDPAAYRWRARWDGLPAHELVIYELHVGAFTPQGDFRAAIDRLDHLAGLGVTAVEIMPVADFPGRRGWGYDGVLLYAPDAAYGRPEDFKAFVDAAHERGLGVLLDVVYNHFGPDGNYLSAYAPGFFDESRHTPWGAAIRYGGEAAAPAREFVVCNALYWLTEFNLDGLRLDAVHAIFDESDPHLLDEIATRARALSTRPVHLFLENEHCETRLVAREDGAPKLFSAQWNDDVHHALHVAATGEDEGYYRPYAGRPDLLARSLADGFACKASGLPPCAFVAFIQNHDHVGNRAFGERIDALAPPHAVRAISAIYLLCPQIPMIFMGEEFSARTPFLFFCDFPLELGASVRAGRRAEFARFKAFVDPARRETIPDPQALSTFEASKLDWAAMDVAALARYREILAVRRREVVPLLPALTRPGEGGLLASGALDVRWRADDGRALTLLANPSPQSRGAPPLRGRAIWTEGAIADGALGPWSLRWSIENAS